MARSRRWGWHELDPRWARRIVEHADIKSGDLVLDIGAGRGALTRPLLDAGARVIAVELHAGRVGHLRRHFGSSIVVVQTDAADLRLPRRPFRVVANPPFAISSALFTRLLHRSSRLESAHVLVQHQLARSLLTDGRPKVARLRTGYEMASPFKVPRSAFSPRPRVDVRLLEIRRQRR